MGRGAGELLRGTDFFYPSIVKLDDEMRETMLVCNVSHLVEPGSVLIGMHQGVELYLLTPGESSGSVFLCIEYENEPRQNWPTLLDFLADEANSQLAIRRKYKL